MTLSKFNKAQVWFENLRDQLILSLEEIDSSKFKVSKWDHKGEGGGKMSILKGSIIEKGIKTSPLFSL